MKTIFVSSTFTDMHFERDAIQEKVLPRLKEEAVKYGDNISFCDLRWGINTGDLDSEEGAKKVLDVCLDEIDRCNPPMVVILGNRYGWIPAEEITRDAAGRKKMELEDLQISVTALEIAYGALTTGEQQKETLFYFRNMEAPYPEEYGSEDEIHEEKLRQLKDRIFALTGGKIKSYTVRWNGNQLEGIDEFVQMLEEDIKAVLLPLWKAEEKLSPFERERAVHWSFINEKNQIFSARQVEADAFFQKLDQENSNRLVIKGESGMGKSMLLSRLAVRFKEAGYDVLPFISGLTTDSNDSLDILNNSIYYLEEKLKVPHEEGKEHTVQELTEKYAELCLKYSRSGKQLVILVDAVDQLAEDENRDNLIFVPTVASEHIKFVMTCLPEIATADLPLEYLKPMGVEEKRMVVEGILRSHGRELDRQVVEKMISLTASENPLYLSLLVQRLIMMNREDFEKINRRGSGMEVITGHQLELLTRCPDSLEEMSAILMQEAGKRINEELINECAMYMAVSRRGLRREDLQALLREKWNNLDFSHFISYMSESFMQREDGCFDFTHKGIREGFLTLCGDEGKLHNTLLDYYKSLPDYDAVKRREIVYHIIKADDKTYFAEYIISCQEDYVATQLAAKDTFRMSMKDSGAWICEVLRMKEVSLELFNFVSFCFANGTPKEARISKRILEENIASIQRCIEQTQTAEAEEALALVYNQYAFVCGKIGEKENIDISLEYYHKSICTIEAIAEKYEDRDYRRDLALRYSNYGHTLKLYGDEDRLHQAVEYLQKAISLREELLAENDASADSIWNLAVIYEELGVLMGYSFGMDEEEKALVYLEKSLELKKECEGSLEQDAYDSGLIDTYCGLVGVYRRKSLYAGSLAESKAFEYCKLAVALLDGLIRRSGKKKYLYLHMAMYCLLGVIWTDWKRSASDLEEALKCYEKVIASYKAMDEEDRHDEAKESYVRALDGMAKIIRWNKSVDRYDEGIEYLTESILIKKDIAERYQVVDKYESLIDTYAELAMLYAQIKTKENTKRARECVDHMLENATYVEKNLGSSFDYYSIMATNCIKVSAACKGLGGLGKRLSLYVKGVKYVHLASKLKAPQEAENNLTEQYEERIEEHSQKVQAGTGLIFSVASVILAVFSHILIFLMNVVKTSIGTDGFVASITGLIDGIMGIYLVLGLIISVLILVIAVAYFVKAIRNKALQRNNILSLILSVVALFIAILTIM